jgi:hypothetical protein
LTPDKKKILFFCNEIDVHSCQWEDGPRVSKIWLQQWSSLIVIGHDLIAYLRLRTLIAAKALFILDLDMYIRLVRCALVTTASIAITCVSRQ